MGVGVLERHYINLGGTLANVGAIRWGFKAPKSAYKNLEALFGVTTVTDNDQSGIVYGCNSPQPVRVRVAYDTAGAGAQAGAVGTVRSVRRFCEPDLLNNVLFGSANAAKVNVVDLKNGGTTEYEINNVSLA